MTEFFTYLVAFTSLISMLHLGFYIVGANVYDIKQFRRAKKLRLAAKTRKKALHEPLVSVVVPAYNEEVGIVRTLDSLLKSDYGNFEIIVVDDGSKDKTAKIVQKYIRSMPRRRTATYMARSGRSSKLERRVIANDRPYPPVTLVRQKNMGKGAALNNAIANHARGIFVMCLDADSLVREDAITNTVAHFRDPSVLGVAANVRVMGDNSWLSQLQRFEHMIGYRSKKFYSMTGTEFIIGGVASTYRRTTLKKVGLYDTDTMTEDIGLSMKIISKLGNDKKHIRYAADVVAMTGGVLTYRQLIKQRYRWKMGMLQNLFKYRSMLFKPGGGKFGYGLTLYRLPMAVLSEVLLLVMPVILGYLIYTSIAHQTLDILIGAYITITAYVLWNIWPDEYLTFRQKMKMSVSALFMYLVFYAMDFVQILAMIKSLRNYKLIIGGNVGHGTWTPPTRIAAPQPVSI